jgi:hypothetical protein
MVLLPSQDEVDHALQSGSLGHSCLYHHHHHHHQEEEQAATHVQELNQAASFTCWPSLLLIAAVAVASQEEQQNLPDTCPHEATPHYIFSAPDCWRCWGSEGCSQGLETSHSHLGMCCSLHRQPSL